MNKRRKRRLKIFTKDYICLLLKTYVLRNSAFSCLGVDQLCVRLHWSLLASYLVIARRNPVQYVTVHHCLIAMEGDKLTLTY